MAKLQTITSFKQQLRGGAARPNLFEVDLTNFGGSGAGDLGWNNDAQEDFRFLCKASSMPTQTIGSVDVPFRGRILKVAGDRTFEPWSVTVINDEDFNVRTAFEKWSDRINGLHDGQGVVNPSNYMGNGTVKQLGRSKPGDDVLQTYTVQDIWPSEISSIDLSYDSSDAIEEFTVTFQIQYFSIANGNLGYPSGSTRQSEQGDPAGTDRESTGQATGAGAQSTTGGV